MATLVNLSAKAQQLDNRVGAMGTIQLLATSIGAKGRPVGSRKKSARAAQRAAFEAHLGDGSGAAADAFSREAARREEHLRYRACDRKKRYATRAEAEDAIRSCKRHGSRNLACYECDYCSGWHLTHKK